MFSIDSLPALNSLLNATSAILVLTGYRFIKIGKREAHRACMIGACCVSALFLISYLTYHYYHGSERFQGQGWSRPVYFAILISHTILAAGVVPLVITTLLRGLRGRYVEHKKIAKWTFPIWLYVSTTGVIIYFMLYQIFRAQ